MALATAGNISGYRSGGIEPGPAYAGLLPNEEDSGSGYWSLQRCRQAYSTYLWSKRPEIDEQIEARRYRHGAHWTSEQVKILNDRRQPVVTYNRIGRKIDGIVGLTERLRQDPKAYPRTPQHQAGADLATAVLRYLMDANKWKEKSTLVSEFAAIDGISGVELGLSRAQSRGQSTSMSQPGIGHNGGPPLEPQQPDMDVTFSVVDNDGFFYDPRSFKHDFSDARYMGVGKWVDEELLKELMPQFADAIDVGLDRNLDLTTNSDRDARWYQDNGEFHQVRLVDVWYKQGRGWAWTLFTGGQKLMEGQSPFFDQDGETICKYLMFSAAVDHDGDRYGFPRNLRSAQDEINQRRSKALHELNNRRIRATKAAIADNNVEALRREAAKADGILLSHTSIDEIQFDDQAKQAAVMGHLEFLREAKSEIENFGPNPAVLGDAGIGARSGRAIQLLQQAGIAELGPYMTNLRSWKIRLYTALFNAAQKYWTQERWIRVTDKQGQPQFVGINQPVPDPMTGAPQVGPDGQPQLINPIGELDVDIILDEGPDSVTIMQDTYDAISQALPALAPMLGPGGGQAILDVLVETSPLPADVKDRFKAASQQAQQQGGQPDPKTQALMAKTQIDQQAKQSDIQIDQFKAQQKAALQQAEAQQKAALEQQKAENQIMIERYKAAAKAQIEREKALMGPQLHLDI
jgi:hypothetical protein